MSYIEWIDQKFSVGVKEIDDQHKHLVDALNNLYASIHSGSGQDEIYDTIKYLVNYLNVHFEKEEKLMSKINYKYKNEHIHLHREFVSKVKSFLIKMKKNEKLSPLEVASFMQNWVLEHIAVEDKKVGIAIQNLQKAKQLISK